MAGTLRGVRGDRLERSSNITGDLLRVGADVEGIERAEVFLSARAFAPHRHDTYGIGITTVGVQTFRYRGVPRISLPGQIHVLHPGETHDGAPATEDGFGYRILHIAPALVQEAMTVKATLPFVAEPVQRRGGPALGRVRALLDDVNEPMSDLERVETASAVADLLVALTGHDTSRGPVDTRAVTLAREYLEANLRRQTPASTLESVTGLDRFTLTRHFRRAFGTSPGRYRTTRRVALARAAIESGVTLAEAALDAGFADQAHMTRHFKRTYGLTPAVWLRLVRGTRRRDN